jgi:hypothetical protein
MAQCLIEVEFPLAEDFFADRPFEAEEAAAPGQSEPIAANSQATERFRSCRWRRIAEAGGALLPECCTHRDVLPMTGANGFDLEAWCPDCGYYKLRRTPKKREDWGERY